MLAAT